MSCASDFLLLLFVYVWPAMEEEKSGEKIKGKGPSDSLDFSLQMHRCNCALNFSVNYTLIIIVEPRPLRFITQ